MKIQRLAWWASLTALLAVVAVSGFSHAYGQFTGYDDEGFVLLLSRLLAEGFLPYVDVAMPYGPGYALLSSLLGAAGLATHDLGRLIALACWVSSAVLGGISLRRLGADRWLAVAGAALLFDHLDILLREPGHPQQWLVLMLLAMPLAASAGQRRGAVCCGVLLSLAALFKANIGVFAMLSMLLAFALDARAARRSRWLQIAPWLVFIAIGSVIVLLLGGHLDQWWALRLAIFVLGACLVLVLDDELESNGLAKRGWIVSWVAAGAITTAAIIAAMELIGVDLSAMVGIQLENARLMAEVFVLPARSHWLGFFSLGAALVVVSRPTLVPGRFWPALVMSVALIAVVFSFRHSYRGLLSLVLPWAWLILRPRAGLSEAQRRGRSVLACLALLQPLQAFPVTGSQERIGAMLLILIGLIALGDALDNLAGASMSRLRRSLPATVFGLSLLACAHGAWQHVQVFSSAVNVDFPGTKWLRLSEDQAADFGCLVGALQSHRGGLLTTPGFQSLHLWSEKRPPHPVLIPHWAGGVGQRDRRSLIEALDDGGVWVVLRPPLHTIAERLTDQRVDLDEAIEARTVSILEVGGYDLRSPEAVEFPSCL